MFKEMEYVFAVYEERSFSKAAKKLHISQPALSNIVKKAETEIGMPIFDRSTIPLTVTKAGEFYIQSIQQIRAIQKNVEEYFEDVKNTNTGELVLGGSSYFCSFVFPEMISRFHRRYPNITIHLKEDMVDHLREELLHEEIDLVLETAFHEEEPDIRNVFYKNEHIILAVPKILQVNLRLQPYQIGRHEIICGRFLHPSFESVPMIHFKDTPFIKMKPGNDMYLRSTQICRNAGFDMNAVLYVDQVMTSLNIAATGTGALFISSDIVRHLPPDPRLVYYKIGDPLAERKVNWSFKKTRYLSNSVREFIRIGNGVE